MTLPRTKHESRRVMHNPPHSGEVLLDGWLDPLESVPDAVQRLGVTRKTLSAILNGRAGISAVWQ